MSLLHAAPTLVTMDESLGAAIDPPTISLRAGRNLCPLAASALAISRWIGIGDGRSVRVNSALRLTGATSQRSSRDGRSAVDAGIARLAVEILESPASVLSRSDRLQVSRIHAFPIPAQVVELEAVGDDPHMRLIHDAMGEVGFAVDVRDSVASLGIGRAFPVPAVGHRVDRIGLGVPNVGHLGATVTASEFERSAIGLGIERRAWKFSVALATNASRKHGTRHFMRPFLRFHYTKKEHIYGGSD